MTHPVLELQAADTMADQLRHRKANLPEREHLQATKNELIRWNEARTIARRRVEELEAAIEETERASAKIDAKIAKLNAQMKTIIAPREAEALQSEIATLRAERSDLDDAELAAMDEHGQTEAKLQELLAQEGPLTEAYIQADRESSAAELDIDGELARVEARLDDLRKAVDRKLLRRYDRLREQHLVAAATLAGSRCDGCHLDLSAVEIDRVRDEAAENGVADCPQCGRLLVV